jgi:hypothetical protein
MGALMGSQKIRTGRIVSLCSALDKDDGEHSISTVKGDSGLPLFNQSGQIVGIHTGGYEHTKLNTYQCPGNLPASAGKE